MSYSISHHLCNCSLTSTIYWLPVGTHVSGTDPRFDPEEQLAVADFGPALAKMKCPSNYLSGLTKYVLTSSILPIPVAINGYVLYGRCIKHVLVNMPNTFLLLSLPFSTSGPFSSLAAPALWCLTLPIVVLSVPLSIPIKPVAINSWIHF